MLGAKLVPTHFVHELTPVATQTESLRFRIALFIQFLKHYHAVDYDILKDMDAIFSANVLLVPFFLNYDTEN